VSKSRLHELSERGQSVWFDTLSRPLIETGELKRMMEEDAVVGVTSNPTIFQKALAEGDAYDDQLRECLDELDDPREIFFRLALEDIRDACDVLRPVWDEGKGQDGYVSMEVDPDLAYGTEATFDQARWIAKEVDRQNLFVKIPATMAGLPAIEDCIAKGTPINITLIFSLDRYKAVVEAYLRGLERVGRKGLEGKLAIANAKLAYDHYLQTFKGERWEFLAGKGATKQRCLWASTSTKNPDYRDVMYVEELVGTETVNTMPLETIRAFQDHGEIRGDTVLEGVDEARKLLDDLREAGVEYDDVVETIEAEGVQKFSASFAELIEGIQAKRGALAAA